MNIRPNSLKTNTSSGKFKYKTPEQTQYTNNNKNNNVTSIINQKSDSMSQEILSFNSDYNREYDFLNNDYNYKLKNEEIILNRNNYSSNKEIKNYFNDFLTASDNCQQDKDIFNYEESKYYNSLKTAISKEFINNNSISKDNLDYTVKDNGSLKNIINLNLDEFDIDCLKLNNLNLNSKHSSAVIYTSNNEISINNNNKNNEEDFLTINKGKIKSLVESQLGSRRLQRIIQKNSLSKLQMIDIYNEVSLIIIFKL